MAPRCKALILPLLLTALSLTMGMRGDTEGQDIASKQSHSSDLSVTAWLDARGFQKTSTLSLTKGGSLKAVVFLHEAGACELLAIPLDPADEVLSLVSRRVRADTWADRALWMGTIRGAVPAPWRLHLDQLIHRVREGRPAPDPVLLLSGRGCRSWALTDTSEMTSRS